MSEAEIMDPSTPTTFSIKNALVALELGLSDEKVLDYLNFFNQYNPIANTHFFHVLPKFSVIQWNNENEEQLEAFLKLDEAVMETMKRDIANRFSNTNISFETEEGDPLEELLDEAEDLNADLVVIGQRSNTKSHGILARQLARKTTNKAFIIPELSELKLSKILVPFDFSKNAIRALETAIGISENWPGKVSIHCVNVYEMPNFTMYKMSRTPEQFKEIMRENRTEAFKIFLAEQPEVVQQNIFFHIQEKDLPGIAKYLLDFQEDEKCDLVVMGAKGHSKVELLLMGSVTERFLTLNNRVPTIVVK